MKKNTLLIRLMTLFIAIVGLNAAVLVGYIMIYPQFNGDFSRKSIPGDSPGIVSAQADNFHEEIPFISSEKDQNNIPISEEHTEETGNNTLSEDTGADYSPVKQIIFEDLAHREELSGGQEQQILLPEENPNAAISQQAQATQESYTTMQEYDAPLENTENSYSPEQNYSEAVSPTSTEISSANFSGNADNFYTHDNPHLQQTADAFVLNTSSSEYIINTDSGYFHIPNGCKYITYYSEPEDCVSTNSSREELISQGYRACHFCFG